MEASGLARVVDGTPIHPSNNSLERWPTRRRRDRVVRVRAALPFRRDQLGGYYSDGVISSVPSGRLQDIHYRGTVSEARPDPVDLWPKRSFFQWELNSDFDVFYGGAERYAKILGTKGLKAYRQLADAEWAKVPPRTAKHDRSEWGQHFRITHIMESLARASGDIEVLVAVMSRDLSSAYSYLRIAEGLPRSWPA